jgi:predicted DNA-binding transcriptional regulator YafY
MRTYRVGRILSVEPLEGYFTRLGGFDLAGYWQEWSAEFRDRMYTAEALIRLSPDTVPMLRVTLGAAITDAALAEAGPPDGEGWIRVRLAIESQRHACWQLMRLGAAVEVLEPLELRTMMTEAVAELSALYGRPPHSGTAPAAVSRPERASDH